MARYYNATRGPIAISLSSGNAVSVSPKSWIEIDPADEGSPNLAPLVRKKYLIRSALDVVTAAPAVAAAPVEAAPAPAPAPVPAPAAPAAPAGGASAMMAGSTNKKK